MNPLSYTVMMIRAQRRHRQAAAAPASPATPQKAPAAPAAAVGLPERDAKRRIRLLEAAIA
jgi:hypothetical protein